ETSRGAVTRACLWNLVVHMDGDVAFEHTRKLIDDAVPACPARVLLLRLNPEGNADGAELEAWISANCQIAPGGGKLVCSEEITREARGGGLAHVPSLVRALLVPDVPTALLWRGAPPTSLAPVQPLIGVTERLIVDTGDLTGRAALVDASVLLELD